MGQGKPGIQGDTGPKGDPGKTEWAELDDNIKGELAKLLVERYAMDLRGEKGEDGNVQWGALTEAQKGNIIDALKTKYGDELRANLNTTDMTTLITNLKNNNEFVSNLSIGVAERTDKLTKSIADTIAKEKSIRADLATVLAGNEKFLDALADYTTKNDVYKERIRGPPPQQSGINNQMVEAQLKPRTMWCADGDYCTIPSKNSAIYTSYGINFIHPDAMPKGTNQAPILVGGKIGYVYGANASVVNTAGNALIIEGVGTTQGNRRVLFWDNIGSSEAAFVGVTTGGLLVDGGNDEWRGGGYIEFGEDQIKTAGGQEVANNKVFLSNIPMIKDGMTDNTWVRLIKDINNPTSWSKGLAAKKLWAQENVDIGGALNIGTSGSKIYNEGDNFKITTDKNLYFDTTNPITMSGNFDVGGYNLSLGKGRNERGDSGLSRALVKDVDNKLVINYGGDFKGGVNINGNVVTDGDIRANGNINVGSGTLDLGGNKISKTDDGLKIQSTGKIIAETPNFNINGSILINSNPGKIKLYDIWISKADGDAFVRMGTNPTKNAVPDGNLALDKLWIGDKLDVQNKIQMQDGGTLIFGEAGSRIREDGELRVEAAKGLNLVAPNGVFFGNVIKMGDGDNNQGVIKYGTESGSDGLHIFGKGPASSRKVKVMDRLQIGDWTIFQTSSGKLQFKKGENDVVDISP